MMHVTQELLKSYFHKNLSKEREQELLEHIAVCDECAEKFADGILSHDYVSSPKGLLDEIIHQVEQQENNLESMQTRKQQKRREFWNYSFRVGFAAAAAIVVLFSTSTGSYQKQTNGMEDQINMAPIYYEDKNGRGERVQEGHKAVDSLSKISNKIGDVLFSFTDQFSFQDSQQSEKEKRGYEDIK